MDWSDVEDALRYWVKTGSGYGDSAVIFSDQQGPRPSGDHITIKLMDIAPLSPFDLVETFTDLSRDPGEEIEVRVTGLREFTVSIQAFAVASTGDSTARSILGSVQTAARLPSVAAEFDAKGFALIEMGRVQNISAVLGNRWEGRAILEARFFTDETVSEYTGYIETVELKDYMGPPHFGTKDDIDI